jgi:hypothetical protein
MGCGKTALIHFAKPDFLALKQTASTLDKKLSTTMLHIPHHQHTVKFSFHFYTAITCSHQKMSAWIKDICRMKLTY